MNVQDGQTPQRPLRVVAVIAARNEERFIAACLENLFRQGVQAYLCDNGSTDRTVEIAQAYLGAGLVGIEHIDFDGTYRWERILRRKEALFHELDADWLMHVDADEIHLPPPGHATLVEAIAAADAQGYEAVEMGEYTFLPTCEAPDHDHADFVDTLRTYYPFRPRSPHCVRAFRKQDVAMEIAWSGGHRVRFPHEPVLSPVHFRFKHYIFLSAAHASRKYPGRKYCADEIRQRGWHSWRPLIRTDQIMLPSATQVRTSLIDADLDPSEPWSKHWLDKCTVA